MGTYKAYLGPILTIYALAGEESVEIKCFTEHSLYALLDVLESNGYSVEESRPLSKEESDKNQEKFEALNPSKVLKEWFMELTPEDQHELVIHVNDKRHLLSEIDQKEFTALMISRSIIY